jgi:hypothetical protein
MTSLNQCAGGIAAGIRIGQGRKTSQVQPHRPTPTFPGTHTATREQATALRASLNCTNHRAIQRRFGLHVFANLAKRCTMAAGKWPSRFQTA